MKRKPRNDTGKGDLLPHTILEVTERGRKAFTTCRQRVERILKSLPG